MKNIWQVFTTDIRKIFAKPFAAVVLIGIMIIPALYAWFNIYANWDPYSNTNGLKVAVANDDEGASVEGLSINVGGMIIAKLADNDKIGWVFVDKEKAIDGTESGEYYAAVIIPEDFSSKILSIVKMDIQRPTIEYYVNEKKNAIAPKITNSGINTVQQQVNETFISTVTEVVSTMLIDTNQSVGDAESSFVGNVLSDLKQTRDQLVEYQSLTAAVKNATLSVDSALGAAYRANRRDAAHQFGFRSFFTYPVNDSLQHRIGRHQLYQLHIVRLLLLRLPCGREMDVQVDQTRHQVFSVKIDDPVTAQIDVIPEFDVFDRIVVGQDDEIFLRCHIGGPVQQDPVYICRFHFNSSV